MPSYSGTYGAAGTSAAAQPRPCRLEIDQESLTLIPAAAPPLSLDLGDIDELSARDYELHLKLYTGESIILSRFGKSFQGLCHDLQEAHRKRLVQCLLLNDLEEIARFDGSAELRSPDGGYLAPAEIRLYQSSLAVLPLDKTGFQWRLAEIDDVSFDGDRYAVVLKAGDESLSLTRLAKRTREFTDKLQAAMAEVARKTAVTLRRVFPFLTPDQFRRAAEFLREGRVVSMAQLSSIDPKTGAALLEKVVSARLKPYYDFLAARVTSEGPYAGFRLIRKEDEEAEGIGDQTAVTGTPLPRSDEPAEEGGKWSPPSEATDDGSGTEVLHWFLFPLRSRGGSGIPDVAAWETTSRSGRATYFFRLFEPDQTAAHTDPGESAAAVEQAVRRLNHALVLLNFRREPVYLSDDALALKPKYRHYAIACRKMTLLRLLREAFVGRAIHAAPKAWQQQVESLLSRP